MSPWETVSFIERPKGLHQGLLKEVGPVDLQEALISFPLKGIPKSWLLFVSLDIPWVECSSALAHVNASLTSLVSPSVRLFFWSTAPPPPMPAGRSITLSQTHPPPPTFKVYLIWPKPLPSLAHLPISPMLTTSSHAILLPVLAMALSPCTRPPPPTTDWFPPSQACGLSSCHLLRGVMLMAESKVASWPLYLQLLKRFISWIHSPQAGPCIM